MRYDLTSDLIILNLCSDEMLVILFAPYIMLANSHIFCLIVRYALSASEKFDKYYGHTSQYVDKRLLRD